MGRPQPAELPVGVGSSEWQISRLELNQRPPDAASLAARFVPTLRLGAERDWQAHQPELAKPAVVEGEPEAQGESDIQTRYIICHCKPPGSSSAHVRLPSS